MANLLRNIAKKDHKQHLNLLNVNCLKEINNFKNSLEN